MTLYRADFYRQPNEVFTQSVLKAAGKHASAGLPNEVCGLVRGGEYIPCTNIAADPEGHFEIPGKDLAMAYKAGDLQGVIHSHPGGPWMPSAADMASQIETNVPWAILIPGDDGLAELACHWGSARPPLYDGEKHIQRDFLSGVSDCYSTCQDYAAEFLDVQLPDYPRDWEWWTTPATPGGMYLDNLQAQGFEVVSTDPFEYAKIAKPHDAYLMAIRSKVPNHAGFYKGGGILLEHMHGSLSHEEPIARKLKHISHWLRYSG